MGCEFESADVTKNTKYEIFKLNAWMTVTCVDAVLVMDLFSRASIMSWSQFRIKQKYIRGYGNTYKSKQKYKSQTQLRRSYLNIRESKATSSYLFENRKKYLPYA